MPTLSELRAVVRQDELLNSTDVISDANLNTLLNEGALQFAKDGDPFIITATWNTAASTSEYVISGASAKVSNFLSVYWPTGGLLYNEDSSTVLLPGVNFTIVTEQWLNREIPGWKSATASDTLIHVYFGYNSSGYLILGTYPAASTATPSFKLWFKSRGTDMDADANYPYLNSTSNLSHIEPFQKGIAYWAMHVIHRDKTKNTAEADRYLGLYNVMAEQCRSAQQSQITGAQAEGLYEAGREQANQTFGSL